MAEGTDESNTPLTVLQMYGVVEQSREVVANQRTEEDERDDDVREIIVCFQLIES